WNVSLPNPSRSSLPVQVVPARDAEPGAGAPGAPFGDTTWPVPLRKWWIFQWLTATVKSSPPRDRIPIRPWALMIAPPERPPTAPRSYRKSLVGSWPTSLPTCATGGAPCPQPTESTGVFIGGLVPSGQILIVAGAAAATLIRPRSFGRSSQNSKCPV